MLPIIKPYKDGYVLYNPERKKYLVLSIKDCSTIKKVISVMKNENTGEISITEPNVMQENLIYSKYRFIALKTPLKVFWDITDECNGRCIHCFTDSGNRKSDELRTEQVLEIIDQLYDIGIMNIAFSGGEPFIRRDMMQIIKYATDKGFAISMTTNGTLLNKEIIEFLMDMKIKSITFSLDGFSQEVFGEIRRGLDLKVLLENIKYSVHCAAQNNIEINVRTTVNQKNVHEINKMLEFCSDNKVTSYKINNTNLWGRAKNEPSLRLEEEKFKSLLISLHEKKQQFNCKIELPIEKYLCKGNNSDLGSCTSTIDTINIFSNGDIGACGFCEKRIIFGNLVGRSVYCIFEKNLPFNFNNEVCKFCDIVKYKGEKKMTSAASFI